MDVYSILLVAVAVIVGVLACLGQAYYYARYIYGESRSLFGGIDPIGSGQPDAIEPLQSLGVPMARPGLTDVVMLIDETETHYLISIVQETGHRAIKVAKDVVRAILYLN